MDEDLTAPHDQCPVHKKYDRQPVAVQRCPDEFTVDHEYEPMDEGIPPPQQCPVQKKYDRQPVAVDRPQGCPDESTVDYEPMNENILQRTLLHENEPADTYPLQNHPTAAEVSPVHEFVDTDPTQDIPAKSPALYAAIDSDLLPRDIPGPVEHHLYDTVDSEPLQNTSDEPRSRAVYDTVKTNTQPAQDSSTGLSRSSTVHMYEQTDVGAPPNYDQLIVDQMQPHHHYQILDVATTSPSEVQTARYRQGNNIVKRDAKIVLIFAIIMLVLFGIYLIFLPLIIPAIVLAALALSSTGDRQKKMVAIGMVLDTLTLICVIVLSPGIVCAWFWYILIIAII